MSLALHYWMRGAHHCSGPPVSEMTYTVSSGTLNSTIPYHNIRGHVTHVKQGGGLT